MFLLENVKSQVWNYALPNTNNILNLSPEISTVNIDMFGASRKLISSLHQQNRTVSCYITFGMWVDWTPDAKLFPSSVKGGYVPEWNNYILNYKSPIVKGIMKDRIVLAKSKGCDSIDTDNMDTYEYKPNVFNLTYNDQLAYNKWVAQEVHKLGMNVTLKNDWKQVKDLVDYFDGIILESCWKSKKCASIASPFVKANKSVYGVEYPPTVDEVALKSICCDLGNDVNFILKNKNLLMYPMCSCASNKCYAN